MSGDDLPIGSKVSVCGTGGTHLYYARVSGIPRRRRGHDNMVPVMVYLKDIEQWGDERYVAAECLQTPQRKK